MSLFLSGTVSDKLSVWPLNGPRIRIGRSSRNEIQITDATVSKEHAEILQQGDRYLLRDLGSRNGSRVNGTEAGEPIPIAPGDRVEIGHISLAVTRDAPSQPVRLNESTVLGSSLRMRADQLLERKTTSSAGSGAILRLLVQAGQLLVLPRPLRETCEQILELVEKVVPASRYILLMRSESDGEPVQIAGRYAGGGADRPLALSKSIVRTVLDECTSVVTADASLDPRFQGQQSIVAQAVHSAMAVPLFDNHKVLGLIYVDSQSPRVSFGESQLELLTLLANMAAVKISNARLLETEQARLRMQQELATATQIQRGLLPSAVPSLPGWAIDAHLETCYEVGGDLYDFRMRADGTLVFVIGDVAGKGMGAALLMSSFLSASRLLYDTCADPGMFATRLGTHIHETADAARFVTGIVGCLDPATGRLHYVNAGHPAACLVQNGKLRELASTGVPFGILKDFKYVSEQTVVEPGEFLALFSDGIPEAEREGEFFDDERVHAALIAAGGEPTLAAARALVLKRVEEFVAGSPRSDDITLLLLRREAGA
jgi:serine phosphatase RsbU (regulator of sigma subunit)